MADGRYVAYYRVSTASQGRSGLGLAGQREAVRVYLASGTATLLGEMTEVESGGKNDRPELARALDLCRMTGAALVIAKLDRLSRDAHFLLGLAKAGVAFVAVDMPSANALTVGVMALVAEEERRAVSARTKTALAAAKARGQVLGGWRGGPVVDGTLGAAAQRRGAEDFAASVGPTVNALRASGLSLNQIGAELARRGILTRRGGAWSADAVRQVLNRYGTTEAA